MANQYSDSFKCILERKHSKTYDEVLKDFANDGLTLATISQMTGCKVATVKKWAERADVVIARGEVGKIAGKTHLKKEEKERIQLKELWSHIRSKSLNSFNFLSRQWS